MVRRDARWTLNVLRRPLMLWGLLIGWGCTSKHSDAPEGTSVEDSAAGEAPVDSGSTGGTDTGQETGEPLLNYSLVFAEVIGPSCRGCHSGQAAAGGLRLESESASYVTLLADYVVPADPSASMLVTRILLDIEDDGLMPPSAPLSETKVSIVVDWVIAGALE